MVLAERCYAVSRRLPKDEQGVLGYQIRKCAVSIPSNIAEGKSRKSTAVYIQSSMDSAWIGSGTGNPVGIGRAREGRV